MESIAEFFNDLWTLLVTKHNEGIYNTVCVIVLLMLPLLVFFTSLVVCCHCCSSFCRGCHCCCCRDSATLTGTQVDKKKKKKKKGNQNEEDLWISVKTDAMTPDRLALTIVQLGNDLFQSMNCMFIYAQLNHVTSLILSQANWMNYNTEDVGCPLIQEISSDNNVYQIFRMTFLDEQKELCGLDKQYKNNLFPTPKL